MKASTDPPPDREPAVGPTDLGGPQRSCVLTINGGSSSLKFAVIAAGSLERLVSGRVERVGTPEARLVILDAEGRRREECAVDAPDLASAARRVVARLSNILGAPAIEAIGHRVVHGGDRFVEPEIISDAMLAELHRLSPLDPQHLPGQIALIEAIAQAVPGIPQVACFDTAFHRTLPRSAQIVAIPRRYAARGVRRYGFHGLSYAYLMEELERVAGPEEASGRVILAHLGSGASLAAVYERHCLDTTMGFTPASGLVMGTRCGDIDPGVVAFLARSEGITPEEFDRMANQESGLLGVSETSADVRDLLARAATDIRAAEAIDLFGYSVVKGIGALSAVLGGLDTLVFSGGIGENSPDVRRLIGNRLEYLGVFLDEARNRASDGMISTDAGRTRVRVIRTDEELMIARAAIDLGVPPS